MSTRSPFLPEQVSSALAERFRVQDVIGSGTQGLVYRAERVRAPDGSAADDLVALKLYYAGDQDERVVREIAAMERIRHTALTTLIEHGEIELSGAVLRYCAWEFIRGRSLDERILAGPFPHRAVAAVGKDVGAAIAEIWKGKIVHRDVSPKNIMLRTGEREAVLIDLGVARHLAEPSLTAYGFSWGTPGYLSPEQCRTERDLTCKSDVFALGVVLIEALIGRHPTQGNQQQLVRARLQTATVAPDAPAAFGGMIDSMLHPRAVARPHPEQISEFFANYLSRTEHVLS